MSLVNRLKQYQFHKVDGVVHELYFLIAEA